MISLGADALKASGEAKYDKQSSGGIHGNPGSRNHPKSGH